MGSSGGMESSAPGKAHHLDTHGGSGTCGQKRPPSPNLPETVRRYVLGGFRYTPSLRAPNLRGRREDKLSHNGVRIHNMRLAVRIPLCTTRYSLQLGCLLTKQSVQSKRSIQFWIL